MTKSDFHGIRCCVVGLALAALGPMALAQEAEAEPDSEAATPTLDIEIVFKQSIADAEAGRVKQAVEALERVRAVVPNDTSVLWNLGLW